MLGMFSSIYGYLARMIGTRNDAADANGSVHAKIVDLKNTSNSNKDTIINTSNSNKDSINSTLQKPRGGLPLQTFTTASASITPALNFSGRGKLNYVQFYSTGGIRITIDGNVFYYNSISNSTAWLQQDGTTSTSFATMRLTFKTSLLIEAWGNSGATLTLKYQYEKE